MSKPFSAISRLTKTGSKGLATQTQPSSHLYFVSNNTSLAALRTVPHLTFKTGGWEEDSRKWGLLWACHRDQHSLSPLKHKQVRVITKSGENVLATSIQ